MLNISNTVRMTNSRTIKYYPLYGGVLVSTGLLGVCFLRGVPEDVVEEIGEGLE